MNFNSRDNEPANHMYFKRIVLIIIFIFVACDRPTPKTISKHSIGIVSYERGESSLQKFAVFQDYLGEQLNSVIEIEPAYNEIKALEQISRQKWDLVFAPPGLAAVAISRYNYEPIMPLEDRDRTRSVIVVRSDSPFEERQDLAKQTIALGQKGSAAGYYLPIYNLYGLKFARVFYAPTPQNVLQMLDEGQVSVGALSVADYNRYRRNFDPNRFKVIYLDKHNVPSGVILISDRLDSEQRERIKYVLSQTPSFISSSAGYLPNEKIPDYTYLIKVIERVQNILENSPMVLQ